MSTTSAFERRHLRRLVYGDLDNLPQSHGAPYFLYCRQCGNRCSATPGDYFATNPTWAIVCTNRHRAYPMILAREECRIIEVEA